MFAIAAGPYRGRSLPALLFGHPCRPKLASGVGQDEQALPWMWRTKGARG